MNTVYNKELDELLFHKQGKGSTFYGIDEKENIFLESLKDSGTIFTLIKHTGRGGISVLKAIAKQYPKGRKERLPKEETKEILNELKTLSIKAICDKHNINPDRIRNLLVARAYAEPSTSIKKGAWSQEEDDYIYGLATEIYQKKGEEGRPKRLSDKDTDDIRKAYVSRFGKKRTFHAVRTRISDLNMKRNSLGNLIRAGRKPLSKQPEATRTQGGSSIDLKDFKVWVQTKGVEIYLREKADELRKQVQGGI